MPTHSDVYAFFEKPRCADNDSRPQHTGWIRARNIPCSATTILTAGEDNCRRPIPVVPVSSKLRLRNLDWIKHNRSEVDRRSGGNSRTPILPTLSMRDSRALTIVFAFGKQSVTPDERSNRCGQA
jgi:hypothetical protein